jgi:hypothetical protein
VGPRLATFGLVFVSLLGIAGTASASRPPTEAEEAELLAAAESQDHVSHGYFTLSETVISTLGPWAAATLLHAYGREELGDLAVFRRHPEKWWVEASGSAGVCIGSYLAKRGMSREVGIDLGLTPCYGLPPVRQKPQVTSKPQVICLFAEGTRAHRTRHPRGCIFHRRGAPVDSADILGMKRLHWRQWGYRSAFATGKAALNMVGLVPAKVKLTHPVTTCGHTVFSHAYFKLPHQFDRHHGWGPGFPLDVRFISC